MHLRSILSLACLAIAGTATTSATAEPVRTVPPLTRPQTEALLITVPPPLAPGQGPEDASIEYSTHPPTDRRFLSSDVQQAPDRTVPPLTRPQTEALLITVPPPIAPTQGPEDASVEYSTHPPTDRRLSSNEALLITVPPPIAPTQRPEDASVLDKTVPPPIVSPAPKSLKTSPVHNARRGLRGSPTA